MMTDLGQLINDFGRNLMQEGDADGSRSIDDRKLRDLGRNSDRGRLHTRCSTKCLKENSDAEPMPSRCRAVAELIRFGREMLPFD